MELPSENDFLITDHIINGEPLKFIRPRPTYFDWTKDTLQFRSSVWNSEGKLVSAGFKKFFNLEEKSDIDPFHGDLTISECIEKLDGSCLIVSKYQGVPILRTRGSFDVSKMPNAHEMEMFLNNDLKSILDKLDDRTSFLFEWQSPNHQVVIKHAEPHLILIGAIKHDDYSMWSQKALDLFAQDMNLRRPERFKFRNKEEMLQSIKALEGQEGICLYYNEGQNIRKVKSTWYLKLHAFRSEISRKSITMLWLEYGRPIRHVFEQLIEKQFDYECLVMAQDIISDLYDNAIEPVTLISRQILHFSDERKDLDQKTFACELFDFVNKNTDLASIGFSYRKDLNYQKNIDKCIMNRMGL